jgi:hypothetical protein
LLKALPSVETMVVVMVLQSDLPQVCHWAESLPGNDVFNVRDVHDVRIAGALWNGVTF